MLTSSMSFCAFNSISWMFIFNILPSPPFRPMLLGLLLSMISFISINSKFTYLYFFSSFFVSYVLLFSSFFLDPCFNFLPQISRQYITRQWNYTHLIFSLIINLKTHVFRWNNTNIMDNIKLHIIANKFWEITLKIYWFSVERSLLE